MGMVWGRGRRGRQVNTAACGRCVMGAAQQAGHEEGGWKQWGGSASGN
jgi:hypothetical protein